MRSDYNIRREDRIERYRKRAERNETEAEAAFKQTDRMAEIMNGQPILVGHHSEKRHRRELKRMNEKTRKALDQIKESESLRRRADAAEDNRTISSDDPEAVRKLKEKLGLLTEQHERQKKVNRMIRAGQWDEIDFSQSEMQILDRSREKGYSWENCTDKKGVQRPLIPAWIGTNRGTEIRRLKKRIEELSALEMKEDSVKKIGDVIINLAASENRVQIEFPGKPSDQIRSELKRSGFRWAPSVGVWQRNFSEAAIYQAERIATLAAG